MTTKPDSPRAVAHRLGRFLLHGTPLALLVAMAALAPTPSARAQAGPTRFALNASGAGVTCDAPSEPTECDVGLGASFKLQVDLLDPPASGYVALQTQIYLDGLAWLPADPLVENVWPDNNLPVRSPNPVEQGTAALGYGGLTATTPPFPFSHYAGPVVEIDVSCPATAQTFNPALLAFDESVSPNGSEVNIDENTIVGSPAIGTAELDLVALGHTQTLPIADIMTIRCGGASAPPGDDIPGFEVGAVFQPPPTGTSNEGTQPGTTPGAATAPAEKQTPAAGTTPASGTVVPGGGGPTGGEEDNGGGGPPWAIVGVVIGAVAVAAAGGGYFWYLRRSRTPAP